MIKDALDKRFGTTWHVVVGEGFGFDISYEITRYYFSDELIFHNA